MGVVCYYMHTVCVMCYSSLLPIYLLYILTGPRWSTKQNMCHGAKKQSWLAHADHSEQHAGVNIRTYTHTHWYTICTCVCNNYVNFSMFYYIISHVPIYKGMASDLFPLIWPLPVSSSDCLLVWRHDCANSSAPQYYSNVGELTTAIPPQWNHSAVSLSLSSSVEKYFSNMFNHRLMQSSWILVCVWTAVKAWLCKLYSMPVSW